MNPVSSNRNELTAILDRIDRSGSGRAGAHYAGCRLDSHYQPIVSLSHQRMVGCEALLRVSRDGQSIAPPRLLEQARDSSELVLLDRLARALHVLNRPADANQWLFLNVHPEVFVSTLANSRYTADLLAQEGIAPAQVVIEVLEDAIRDEALFAEKVAQMRAAGFLIALDDFGAGHSNFDRVWTIQPDIVKLDRSFALRVEFDAGARRVLPRIVNLLHEAGSLVLLEGIETPVQAQIALDADIDFVQGYHFARPGPDRVDEAQLAESIHQLWHDFAAREEASAEAQRELIAPYQNALGYASVMIAAGRPFAEACAGFLDLPLANFCYLLDREGRQIGPNLWGSAGGQRSSQRFLPLANTSEARWSRRPYFRRAIRHHDRVQVTRPYLSASTAEMCVTLSVGFLWRGQSHVLCGDMAWLTEAAQA